MAQDHEVTFRQGGQSVGLPFQIIKLNLENARGQDLDKPCRNLPPRYRRPSEIKTGTAFGNAPPS
jgi:hypothetical protein